MNDTATATVTVESFRALCMAHDLTYAFSDDARVYRRGRVQLTAIYAAARELPQADAVRIWNECVDKRMQPDCRADLYWTKAPQ